MPSGQKQNHGGLKLHNLSNCKDEESKKELHAKENWLAWLSGICISHTLQLQKSVLLQVVLGHPTRSGS